MIVLYGSSTRYILYQHLNLGWRLENLPHIEQGEGVGNLPYIEQREGRTGRTVRAATMGRLGKRGAGYNISFDLFLKPRDVRLGEPETVSQVCPSPCLGIMYEKLAITTLTRMAQRWLSCFVAAVGITPIYAQTSISDVRIIHYFRTRYVFRYRECFQCCSIS